MCPGEPGVRGGIVRIEQGRLGEMVLGLRASLALVEPVSLQAAQQLMMRIAVSRALLTNANGFRPASA